MLIFLVGFMGSGKSTAGQMLANKCGYNFIDLDTEIALKCKKSIPEIFNTEGVDYFRNLETITLKELNPANKTIVATGGGCPCVNDNMNWMNENGVTIYIKAQHGTLFHRLLPNKKNRPLISSLSDVQLMEYIINQLPVRDTVYAQAKHVVETSREQPSVLALRLGEVFSKIPK